MEALFQHLVVGVVPQPRQVPPAPFDSEDLQRVYLEVTREHPYQQFQLLPADSGAELVNTPEDGVVIQPGLFQVRGPITLTPEAAREKAVAILRAVAKRLSVENFVLAGIKVIAHAPAPGANPSAKSFVAEQLMRGGTDKIQELGPQFFAGGLKYRAVEGNGQREDILLIEPLVQKDEFLFIDYDVQRRAAFQGLDQLADWLDEAFSFVNGPATKILEVSHQ